MNKYDLLVHACTCIFPGMAWLYKHPRSGFWKIGWRVGKKLFNRSTKITDRKQAEKQLATFNLMADAKRHNLLTEDFFNSLNGRQLERISLRDTANKYLETCKGAVVSGSFIRYEMVVRSFLEYAHATDTVPLIGDINIEIIQTYLNDIRKSTTAATTNFHRTVLNAMFNHALANKKIRSNPVTDIATYKASKQEVEISRRPFTETEIRDAYAAAPNDFWRFAIVIGLYTGLRLGNVATLRWRNVDLEKLVLKVLDIKGNDELKIPIASKFLLNLFAELKRRSPRSKPDDFIFPEYAALYLNNGESSASKLSIEFRDILVTAKLVDKYKRKKQGNGLTCRRVISPLSYHSLRHNFVTMLKERGASQSVARELVGHSSDAVNELYTHTSEEVIRKSLKRLPEVFK